MLAEDQDMIVLDDWCVMVELWEEVVSSDDDSSVVVVAVVVAG